MLPLLIPAPGKIEELLQILPESRVDNLDYLDDFMTSRAPADTALDKTVWTDALASNLGNCDVSVASRAPADTALSNTIWTDALAGLLPNLDIPVSQAESAILSVQTDFVNAAATGGSGEDTFFVDVPVTAVTNIQKCYVILQPATMDISGSTITSPTARLTSATNLRISSLASANIAARYYVVEMK